MAAAIFWGSKVELENTNEVCIFLIAGHPLYIY